jgi:hypothetical protein
VKTKANFSLLSYKITQRINEGISLFGTLTFAGVMTSVVRAQGGAPAWLGQCGQSRARKGQRGRASVKRTRSSRGWIDDEVDDV